MYSLVSSVALLYFCFTIETTLAAENGYIVTEYPHIDCKDSSSTIPECSSSLDYKIADISNIPNVSLSELEESRKSIGRVIQNISKFADDQCAKGITKYMCETVYPFRCTEAYVEVSGKKIADTCEEAKTNCASLPVEVRDSILNCSVFANNPLSHIPKIPRKLVCGDFPTLKNDPYSCDIRYKVGIASAMISILMQLLSSDKGKRRLYFHNTHTNVPFFDLSHKFRYICDL